jgi:hypothetical protein
MLAVLSPYAELATGWLAAAPFMKKKAHPFK